MRGLGLLAVVLACGAVAWLLGTGGDADVEPSDVGPFEADRAPVLAGRAPAKDDGALLDGQAVLAELQALDVQARGTRLHALLDEGTAPRVAYDEDLVRYLITLLTHADRIVAVGAQQLLARIGTQAAALVLPLLSHDDARLRMAGVGIVGTWARAGFRVPAASWISLFDDADRRVASYAWAVVCAGVPYDETLAAHIERRIRAGPGADHYGPERALVRMGHQGIGRLFALLDRRGADFELNVLSALRSARPEDLRAHIERLEPWLRGTDEDSQVLALQVLHVFDGATDDLMPILLEAWQHESFSVRFELLALFERMGARAAPAAEVLIAAMDDDDERISSRAMAILGTTRAKPGHVLPKLRDALDDLGDDPAAIAMGRYGAAAEPYLRSALESPDEDVRYFALAGVYRMGPSSRRLKDLVRPLVTIDDEEVAHRASMAMGAMGEDGADALPDIWARYAHGKMRDHQMAEILVRMGGPGQAFLLARLAERTQRERALALLDVWPGETRFASTLIDALLHAADPRVRSRAVHMVGRCMGPPPGWERTHGDATYRPAPDVMAYVRERVTPRLQDEDANVRLQARTVLEWLHDAGTPAR